MARIAGIIGLVLLLILLLWLCGAANTAHLIKGGLDWVREFARSF